MRLTMGNTFSRVMRCGLMVVAIALGNVMPTWALTPSQAVQLASGDTDARITVLQQVLSQADEVSVRYLQALLDDSVKFKATQVWVMRDGQSVDPITGQSSPIPDDAEDVINNNRMRGELEAALSVLQLFHPQANVRLQSVLALLKEPDATKLPMLEKALATESDAAVKAQMLLARAAVWLSSEDAAQRLQAAKDLAQSQTPDTQLLLNQRLAQETDAKVSAQIEASLRVIASALSWGDKIGALFTGVSLGSILLLVALGLAITYGLMGVINMAHGELMMIGAYATYSVQVLFRHYALTCCWQCRCRFFLRLRWVRYWSDSCCAICMAAHWRPYWPRGASAWC